VSIATAARRFALAGLFGILAGGLAAAQAQEPLKIKIGWAVAPAQLTPILFAQGGIAKHLGQSYTLEPMRFAGSSVTLQALAAGDLDIAPMTFNVLGPAILNAGMTDLRIIADEIRDGVDGYETNRYMVLKDGPIEKIEDLKGKVAAVNGIGSGQDIFMRAMLRRHGLETPRDYTTIEAQLPSMGSLLIEKKVDLVVGVKPFVLNPAFQAAGKVLFTQRDAVGMTDFLFLAARAGFGRATSARSLVLPHAAPKRAIGAFDGLVLRIVQVDLRRACPRALTAPRRPRPAGRTIRRRARA